MFLQKPLTGNGEGFFVFADVFEKEIWSNSTSIRKTPSYGYLPVSLLTR